MEKFAKKGMAALVGLALVSAAGLAQAETRFAVQDTSANDKFVVTDTGSVGINIATPTYKFQMVGAGDPSTAAMIISNPGRPTASGTLATDSGGFSFMRNNNSSLNGGRPRANDRLGYFGFGSYINNANRWLSFVTVFAEADATTTGAPTYMSFSTSGNSLNATERMRLTSAGNLGIGTTAPSQKLEVNGGIRLNPLTTVNGETVVATRPACTDALRGVIWFTQAANGADTLAVCARDSNNNPDWRNLISP